MKKFTCLFAILFVVTIANAQISLLHTFEGNALVTANVSFDDYAPLYGYIESPYFYTGTQKNMGDDFVVNLYNKEDFSLYKSVHISTTGWAGQLSIVTQNILTVDGKVCFCLHVNNELRIYNEDGSVVADLNGDEAFLTHVNGQYHLITMEHWSETPKTHIYSVPGKGDGICADMSSPSSQKRSSVRKIARNGQVLVETENNYYTIEGQEVK